MARSMIASSSVWSFPAGAEVVGVAIGHVVDPVTFYVYSRDTPSNFIEMEEELKKRVRNLERLPYGTKSKNLSGTIVAYWNTEHREYVRARVEEPYKEMCSGRIKGYIFMIDRGVYAKSYIGDRDIVDLERCCRLIPDELLAAKLQPLAHKIRIPGLTPLVKEIEWSANGSVGTYKPTRNGEFTEAACKFARRMFELAESAAVTKNYELYLLLPEEIDYRRYRSGLCGREELVEPGATINFRDLLIEARFANANTVIGDIDAFEEELNRRGGGGAAQGINRYPRPKFPMFTRTRKDPKYDADETGDLVCKKPQVYKFHDETIDINDRVKDFLAKKKLDDKLLEYNEEEEAVERAFRRSLLAQEEADKERAIHESLLEQQRPSLLTLENLNTREEPNPSLDEKLKHWRSHM